MQYLNKEYYTAIYNRLKKGNLYLIQINETKQVYV